MKSDNDKCDYSAMNTLASLVYEIILKGLDKHVSGISY